MGECYAVCYSLIDLLVHLLQICLHVYTGKFFPSFYQHEIFETLIYFSNLLEQIISFEISDYSLHSDGIEKASADLHKIFHNLTEKSCRFINLKKKK